MKYKNLIISFTCSIILLGCSASYKHLSNIEEKKATNFQEYLLSEYKIRATFEAEEMHDWNSANLYSKKALKSLETDKIFPEKISYWKLPLDKIKEIRIAHDNLLSIYYDAKIIDPYNLAKAIASLDCWSEQQEENWQTWDINRCKEDYLNSMHSIYEKISITQKNTNAINNKNLKDKSENEITIVTKNKNNELMQIIYFDFDKFSLSSVSAHKIKLFLNKYKNEINEYLVVGHTDTKGSKEYNLSLSIKRAEVVKNLLIKNGINHNKVKILGKGEESLAIITQDETKQPGNRRVEIKKTN